MVPVQEKKFRVQGLDCASCAAKIERELRQTEGVEEAVLDFATLTLHLKATDISKALAAVARIEPDVKIVPPTQDSDVYTHKPEEPSGYQKQIAIIVAAGVVFAGQLMFESQLHHSPWAWLEYPLVITAYLLAGWSVLTGALRTVWRKQFFDENVLMVIATVGAMAIHALSEAVGVMLFFKVDLGLAEPLHECLSWLLVFGALFHLIANWRPTLRYVSEPVGKGILIFFFLLIIYSKPIPIIG